MKIIEYRKAHPSKKRKGGSSGESRGAATNKTLVNYRFLSVTANCECQGAPLRQSLLPVQSWLTVASPWAARSCRWSLPSVLCH